MDMIMEKIKVAGSVFWLILIGIIVFAVFCRFSNVKMKPSRRKWRLFQKRTVHRSPKSKASGIIFGKTAFGMLAHSKENDEGNVLVLGQPGQGKTTAVLMPTLENWRGTAYVLDIAGDICKNLQDKKRMVFDPLNADTIPYNVFGMIDMENDPIEKRELLKQLALLLLPKAPNESNTSDASEYYRKGGVSFLKAALICYYEAGFDFVQICKKIVENDWRDLLNDIVRYNNKNANAFIAKYMGSNKENTNGCHQAAVDAVELFATDERLQRCMRRPAENEEYITPPVLEERSVYIVIPEKELELYSPLVHIMTAQLFEFFSNRPLENTNTILFCLDELASFAISVIEPMRKLRKRHCRLLLLTQSLADLDLKYGREERRVMLDTAAFTIIFGARDHETTDALAKMIGRTDEAGNIFKDDHTQGERWIIPPAELASLGENLILLSPDGNMRLRKNYFFGKRK